MGNESRGIGLTERKWVMTWGFLPKFLLLTTTGSSSASSSSNLVNTTFLSGMLM
jgi:hypothetical protein